MLKKNLHNHTTRCHHASGEDEEYIINAIKAGYEEIGFSDHCPFVPYEGCTQSRYRMFIEDAQDYFDSLHALREKYKDKIKIHIGFEMEYYPEYFDMMYKTVKDMGTEYLVLGQHFLGSDVHHSIYSGIPTDSEEVLRTYCQLAVEGLKTGVFTYLAHPDLIYYTGDTDIYEKAMRDMVREVKSLDYQLELNRLGFYEGRNYPNDIFWKIVGEEGARCVIGLDAHEPGAYKDTRTVKKIEKYLAGFGITPEEPVVKLI